MRLDVVWCASGVRACSPGRVRECPARCVCCSEAPQQTPQQRGREWSNGVRVGSPIRASTSDLCAGSNQVGILGTSVCVRACGEPCDLATVTAWTRARGGHTIVPV